MAKANPINKDEWKRLKRLCRCIDIARTMGLPKLVDALEKTLEGTAHAIATKAHPEGSPLAGKKYTVIYFNSIDSSAIAAGANQDIVCHPSEFLPAEQVKALLPPPSEATEAAPEAPAA